MISSAEESVEKLGAVAQSQELHLAGKTPCEIERVNMKIAVQDVEVRFVKIGSAVRLCF